MSWRSYYRISTFRYVDIQRRSPTYGHITPCTLRRLRRIALYNLLANVQLLSYCTTWEIAHIEHPMYLYRSLNVRTARPDGRDNLFCVKQFSYKCRTFPDMEHE